MNPPKRLSHPPARPPRGIGSFSYQAARVFSSARWLDKPLIPVRHTLTINLGVRQ